MSDGNQFERLEFVRDGTVVRLIFHCRDDYAAMLIYDELTNGAKNGGIEIDVALRARMADG